MPLSTASAPVFIGSIMSLPARAHSSAANVPSWSEWNARLTRVTLSSCFLAARTTVGLRCPKLTAE